ncbi:MAG TPA: response regulator [Polyangiaceae bacterium]|nr:response regulator [Polyangiaceae bacterium]
MPVPNPDDRASILIVDDDMVLLDRLVRAFRDRGYEVSGASSYQAALATAHQDPPEFAVVDLRIAEASGLELVRELLVLDPQTQVVILTGYGSIATAVDAVKLGAVYYLAKPADADDILAAFARGSGPPPRELDSSQFEAPSLARAEWEHIHRVLSDCHGNISEAARRLKIHRRSLQRKLNKYAPD